VQADIPVQVKPATASNKLLNADQDHWCLQATDASGTRPAGQLFVRIYGSGSLQGLATGVPGAMAVEFNRAAWRGLNGIRVDDPGEMIVAAEGLVAMDVGVLQTVLAPGWRRIVIDLLDVDGTHKRCHTALSAAHDGDRAPSAAHPYRTAAGSSRGRTPRARAGPRAP